MMEQLVEQCKLNTSMTRWAATLAFTYRGASRLLKAKEIAERPLQSEPDKLGGAHSVELTGVVCRSIFWGGLDVRWYRSRR
jgi:hypothetical protein